ncbi:MAG: hypothetical protein ACLPR9_11185 [Acidimicrobiales bacterium]
MTDLIDGAFDTPEGRRLYVSLRPGESSDEFATRAIGFMYAMSDGHVLDGVLATASSEWETIPSAKWIEAVNQSEPKLSLRVTTLPSGDGGSVGHLVVECEDQLVADDWADLQDESILLPRTRHGQIWRWQATLWSLVHEIRGLGDQYEAALARSGVIVE